MFDILHLKSQLLRALDKQNSLFAYINKLEKLRQAYVLSGQIGLVREVDSLISQARLRIKTIAYQSLFL